MAVVLAVLLKILLDALRRQARVEESNALPAKLTEGLYLKDDVIYRIKKAPDSSRLYRQRLVIPESLAGAAVEERLELLAVGAFKSRGREAPKSSARAWNRYVHGSAL